MANFRTPEEIEATRRKIVLEAAKLFLSKGFSQTKVKDIAKAAGLPVNAIYYDLKDKDEILSELVKFVLQEQFSMATEMIAGKTDDKILYYAVETTLQLYLAEVNENICELYAAAYSLPKCTDYIQRTITEKLQVIFKEHLPNCETKDFYELEIASGGIMRGFLSMPCDMYFTMDRKVSRFLKTTFLVYEVPKDKIAEAIELVSQFDYPKIAQVTINTMLAKLEKLTGGK